MLNLKDAPTTASTLFSAYASFAATMMLVRSMANELVPRQLHSYIYSTITYLFTPLSSHLTLIIDEHSSMTRNQLYEASEIYLRTKISPSTERLRATKTPRKKNITLAIDQGEQVNDTFDQVNLKWRYVCTNQQSESNNNNYNYNGNSNREKRCFELTFHKKHKVKVVDFYLPYVFDKAKEIKEQEKVVKLYTRDSCMYDGDDGKGSSVWGSINLEHPATFETMAMDPELKRMIVEDMDRFLRRREFYKKVGKAWKRGYLLYGPPGTGKSSLIAAMANYLKFDVYDLELTSIYSNSELRRILLSTSNRSILVIEDIDCSLEMQSRQCDQEQSQQFLYEQPNNRLTLSGLLNFIDGLWSSCGDERIIVFTTNHKDRLDPALLRPGRMDMHIHMSYCTLRGFDVLASNYLGIQEINCHPLSGEIEGLMESTDVTPAEVAEELMKSDDADVSLDGLVKFLKRKKVEKDEMEDEGTDKTEIQPEKRQKMDDMNGNKIRIGGRGLKM